MSEKHNMSTWLQTILYYIFLIFSVCQAHSKYIVVSTSKTIIDAQQYCSDVYGSDLASIHSVDDMEEVESKCSPSYHTAKQCFIGLMRDTTTSMNDIFYWTDGSEFDYGNNITWQRGQYPWTTLPTTGAQPNDLKGREDCIVFRFQPTGWADIQCSWSRPFLCNNNSWFVYISCLYDTYPCINFVIH